MHIHQASTNHKLLVLSKGKPWKFQTIDCEAPGDGLTASRSLPFEADGCRFVGILASLDGLVCVGIKKDRSDYEYSDLILWNPLMGDYKRLSKPNSGNQCYRMSGRAFGLYYTSSDDDYKLLRLTYFCDTYIYSLKSDSWRNVKSTDVEELRPIPYWLLGCWEPIALLNEKLYFLQQGPTGTPSYSIMRFDLQKEKFAEIATPFENQSSVCLSFSVVRGFIHFFVANISGQFELWRMDGEGDWTKVVTYDHPADPREQPLHLMSNGNWLMHSKDKTKDEGYVYKVDPEKPHTKDTRCLYTRHNFRIPQGGKYVETLVSPNRYTK